MSMKNPQLPPVPCRYGAPMGRSRCTDGKDKPMRCFYVRFIDGCYDEGGAFWGMPANLYCAMNDHGFQDFVRASSRNEAMDKFEEKHGKLKWKVPRKKKIEW